jgi:hypothetical protein
VENSPAFLTSNAEIHSTSLPIKFCGQYYNVPGLHRTRRIVGTPSPGPRAMVGSKEEANSHRASQLRATFTICFGAACGLNKFTLVRQNMHSRPLLARSQGFNETCERHRGGYAHLCPLDSVLYHPFSLPYS